MPQQLSRPLKLRSLKLATPLALIWLIPAAVSASLLHAGAAHVKFTAKGPGGLNIVGETEAVQVSDDGKLVTVAVPLTGLQTGIGLRDKHMKEKYLEVGKYPNAELKVARDALRFPAAGGKVSADAQGDLTIHGHTKHVSFHYDAKAAGKGFDVDGTVHVKIPDYAIDVPNYLGVTVKPDVDVEVHFHVDNA